MKYQIIILLIISLSCTKSKSLKNIEIKKSENIVLIFKKNTNKSKSLNLSRSKVKYSEDRSFQMTYLYPKNYNKIDTIRIKPNSNKICLSHGYNLSSTYFYEFVKGDTIIFDYLNGIPISKIINRKTLEFDTNFEFKSKLKKPLESYEFVSIKHRQRKVEEERKYKNEIKEYFDKNDKFLDSIYDLNLISINIYELHKNRFKYYKLNIGNKQNLITHKQDLNRDDLLDLSTYRFFLENFVNYSYNNYSSIENRFKPDLTFDYILNSNLFKGKIRDFLLYTYFKNIALKLPIDDTEVYFKKIEKYVNDTILINNVKKTYLIDFNELKKETEKVYYINLKKETYTLEDIIKKNKDKIIYIDFWASWCAPCRVAMPASKKLKKDYKNKDVAFIYISIDKNLNEWQKSSEEETLLFYENNLLAINYPKANFYENLKLKTIPRYLLYNQKGNLIHQNAPGPDSKEIRHLFNKYLED